MDTVRFAEAADVPAILDRWKELMQAHAGLHGELFRLAPGARETYRAHVRRHLDDRDGLVLVAPEGEAIAGYLLGALGQRAPFFAVREAGLIHDLAVRPERRRQGIARALIAAAEAWFSRRGAVYAHVDYSTVNAMASGFWARAGYTPLLAEAYRKL